MTTDQLGHIIKETLVSQRFVVLPQVGAFLLRKMPARIHPVHDRIEPPKDEIRFNEAIKENDGLLVSRLAMDTAVALAEAESEIKEAVARIQFDLANRTEVSFGPLGVLSKNYDGKLIFKESDSTEPWPSHFGLAPIRLKPIETERKVTIKQLAPSAKKLATEFPTKKVIGYAAAFAVLVSLGIIPLTNENNRNMASLSFASFLGEPKEVRYTPREFQPMEVSASYVSEMPVKNVEESTAPTKVEEAHKELSEPANYYVIAGGFTAKSGADRLISDLNSRGFGGIYVGEFDGKHLVSYGAYPSLEDAKGMKASVQLGNPDAWVLAGR